MSKQSESSLPPTLEELQARLRDLESEVQLLRASLEEQTWRMAQLVQENAALKSESGAAPPSNVGPRRAARSRAVLTREELEFALRMGRPGASALD